MFKTKSYHGTSPEIVSNILKHGISVSIGGGELGQGFYTGEHLHEAKAWAYQKSKSKQNNVIEFEHNDEDILSLDIIELNHGAANLKRSNIKKTNQTRVYLFNVDLVWSPIVGTDRVSGMQYKWESSISESLLNCPTQTIKTVI